MSVEQVFSLQQQGRLAEAEQLANALLQESPNDSGLLRTMAVMATQNGKHVLALEYMQRAVLLAPDSIEYQFQLGCLLAHGGDYAESVAIFDKVVLASPDLADAWCFKGISLLRLARDRDALYALRRAYALAPQDKRALQHLAELEFRIGYPADALPLWEQLHRLFPHDIAIILKKGETLSRLGELGEAVSTYSDHLHDTPDSPQLWMALGQAHEDNGNKAAAINAFETALRLRPDWAFPMASLLGVQRGQAPGSLIERTEFLLASSTLDDHDRSLLGYELGKVLDAQGNYAAALASWNDANSARQRMTGSFDSARLDAKADSIITASIVANRPTWCVTSSEDPRFVFIVGMPRSGTTLTEQIVAAHPQTFGCGELPDIALISREFAIEMAQGDQWRSRAFSARQIADAVGKYTEAVTRHASGNAIRLVDKAPLNFWDLDLIARMFPRAHVIWCRRDPRDIAISIYGENFALEERYATSFPAILHYISVQQKVMRHWQAVLPITMHELHYEELVSAPDSEARKLIEFIGLPWDSRCLNFHRSPDGIQSPSRWQVKQPVHVRSVGRWRNYEQLHEVLRQAPESN